MIHTKCKHSPDPTFLCPIFIPEVDPVGGFWSKIDLVQLLLARMLSFCGQVFVRLTHSLTGTLDEPWMLKIILPCLTESCWRSLACLLYSGCCQLCFVVFNQAPHLLTDMLAVCFSDLSLMPLMVFSCNQVSHLLTGMLAVCINELWLLPGMFASFSQISQSLTGTSILLLSSFFKKLKRHRTF